MLIQLWHVIPDHSYFLKKMMLYLLKNMIYETFDPFFKKWYARETMCARLFKIMFQSK